MYRVVLLTLTLAGFSTSAMAFNLAIRPDIRIMEQVKISVLLHPNGPVMPPTTTQTGNLKEMMEEAGRGTGVSLRGAVIEVNGRNIFRSVHWQLLKIDASLGFPKYTRIVTGIAGHTN